MSKRALSHCCSIGPEGILASSVMLSHESKQNANRDRYVPQNDQSCNQERSAFQVLRVSRMGNSHRLKHAPDAMAQMKTKERNCNDVPCRNPPHLKAGNQIV